MGQRTVNFGGAQIVAKSRGRLGAHSRVFMRGVIADTVDGRSREGRLMRHLEAELTAHVGGNPSVVERALIERAVWQTLRVAVYDAKLRPVRPSLRTRTGRISPG
jgi:hypothetical protein